MIYFVTGGIGALSIGAGAAYLLIKDRQRTALQKKMFADYEAEWHFYQRGIDLMRQRAPNGGWQYRAMTDEEYRKHIVDHW